MVSDPAAAARAAWQPAVTVAGTAAQQVCRAAQLVPVAVAVAVLVAVLVGVPPQYPPDWNEDTSEAQTASFPAALVTAAWHEAVRAVGTVAQQEVSAAQLVPVPVPVAVEVLVAVPVVVHTGCVQTAAVTQADSVVRQVKQVAPAALVMYRVEQFASQVVWVASQGQFISQVIQSAQEPPVKLPLA